RWPERNPHGCRQRSATSFTRTMRAERFRGLRIRSRSWRNKLIEKDIRQKQPGHAGLFLLAVMYFTRGGGRRSSTSVFLLTQSRAQAGERTYAATDCDDNDIDT